MKKTILTISNLSFSYVSVDRIKIFEDLNLEVVEKEMIGIKSPSGSGKTTLFELIMGNLKPDSGFITSSIKPIIISQIPFLNPYLTINEIIDLELIKNRHDSNKEIANGLISKLQLQEHLDKLFLTLSGGQKQRVLLITKILSGCEFILADEPFNSLDKKTSIETRDYFMDQLKEKNITLIMTSHNPIHLEHMDKIYTIANHKLVEK